jgi:hypothetical protein
MSEGHDAAEAVARWLSERTGKPVDFERVEPGEDPTAARSGTARARRPAITAGAPRQALVEPGHASLPFSYSRMNATFA